MYHLPLVKWYVMCMCVCMCMCTCACVHAYAYAFVIMRVSRTVIHVYIVCMCSYPYTIFKEEQVTVHNCWILQILILTYALQGNTRQEKELGMVLCITWSWPYTFCITWSHTLYIMHHMMLLLFSYTEGHWSADTPNICKT